MFLKYFFVFLLLLITLVFTVIFIYRKGNITDAKSLLLKSLASICFILTSICAFGLGRVNSFALFIIAGQIFGLLGDMFLDMKYLYAKDETVHTFAGFWVFLIGHICFVAFMLFTYAASMVMLLISLGFALILAIIIYFPSEKIAGLVYGKYRLISTVYMFVLAFTMALAILQIFMNNNRTFVTSKILFAAGMILFMLSDLVLAMIYFTPEDKMNKKAPVRINLGLYYAAQICISVSVLFLGSLF